MRSYQVFASMSPERAVEMMRVLAEKVPAVFAQAIAAAELIYNPDADVQAVEDEFYRLMTDLDFLPNSPIPHNSSQISF